MQLIHLISVILQFCAIHPPACNLEINLSAPAGPLLKCIWRTVEGESGGRGAVMHTLQKRLTGSTSLKILYVCRLF